MGPLLGNRTRWRPRATVLATPIRKRTSHLIIGVTEQESRRQRRQKAEPAAVPEAGE